MDCTRDMEFEVSYDSCFSGCGTFYISGYDDINDVFEAIGEDVHVEQGDEVVASVFDDCGNWIADVYFDDAQNLFHVDGLFR